MRRTLSLVLAITAGAALVGFFYGCTGGGSCADRETCFADVDAQGSADADGPSGDAVTDGTQDAGSEQVTTCDPDAAPKDNPCVLDDVYGVFIAPGAASDAQADAGDGSTAPTDGDGTMAKPYATIGQGLANLGAKRRIYVCNGAYSEQVRIATAVSLVRRPLLRSGGRKRVVWNYVGGSALVSSPPPRVRPCRWSPRGPWTSTHRRYGRRCRS